MQVLVTRQFWKAHPYNSSYGMFRYFYERLDCEHLWRKRRIRRLLD